MKISSSYNSSLISGLKEQRKKLDPKGKDLAPFVIDYGRLRIKIARHFGFCFGVKNAVSTVYQALERHPGKRIFLISEMIHNPLVNNDLIALGVKFIFSPEGNELSKIDELRDDDVVIIPAFGSSIEVISAINASGARIYWYDATCPFVQKVWRRAKSLGESGFTVVIHGKYQHEETRATFSHAAKVAPSVIVRDLSEAELLAQYIKAERLAESFYIDFCGKYSKGFNPATDLKHLGLVNQTTMLAGETTRIGEVLKSSLIEHYGADVIETHFNDGRDTLCYATAENQSAVRALVESGGDIALVVGGYNSSNTSHLVEICRGSLPTFHIKNAEEIISKDRIRHFDVVSREVRVSENWCCFDNKAAEILIAAGASCPDIEVERVLSRLSELSEEGQKS